MQTTIILIKMTYNHNFINLKMRTTFYILSDNYDLTLHIKNKCYFRIYAIFLIFMKKAKIFKKITYLNIIFT